MELAEKLNRFASDQQADQERRGEVERQAEELRMTRLQPFIEDAHKRLKEFKEAREEFLPELEAASAIDVNSMLLRGSAGHASRFAKARLELARALGDDRLQDMESVPDQIARLDPDMPLFAKRVESLLSLINNRQNLQQSLNEMSSAIENYEYLKKKGRRPEVVGFGHAEPIPQTGNRPEVQKEFSVLGRKD